MSARYAGFLQRSLPPFWPTTDRNLVLGALRRLDQDAPPPHETMSTTSAPSATSATTRPVAPDPGPAPSVRTAVTKGHAWTPEQDEELRDGFESEIPLDELADHLELDVEVVAARASALGLS